MHRRLFYIYLLIVPSFSSRYFNKIKLTSRLGRLLALSLEILCIVKVYLLSEREISPNYIGIFSDFGHGFISNVKGLPKTKRCDSVAVTVSVRFRFGFGVYVKRPLIATNPR